MPLAPARLRQVERPNLGCSEAAIGRAHLLPTLAGAASPRGSAVPLPHGGVGSLSTRRGAHPHPTSDSARPNQGSGLGASLFPVPPGPGSRKARVADEHITPRRAEAGGAGSFVNRVP